MPGQSGWPLSVFLGWYSLTADRAGDVFTVCLGYVSAVFDKHATIIRFLLFANAACLLVADVKNRSSVAHSSRIPQTSLLPDPSKAPFERTLCAVLSFDVLLAR